MTALACDMGPTYAPYSLSAPRVLYDCGNLIMIAYVVPGG